MVYKRGNIYWYKFLWHVDTAAGREFFEVRRSARTHNGRTAQQIAEAHRAALARGDVHPRDPFPKVEAPAIKPATLVEYAPVVIRHVDLIHSEKPRTAEFYRECMKRIEKFPSLALAPLSSITTDLTERYSEWRQQAKKGNTAWAINAELRTLRRILRYAAERGVIDKAPAIHALKGCKGRDRVLTATEEEKYLSHATGDLHHAAIIGVETGLRPDSELFCVKWDDILETTNEGRKSFGLRVRESKTGAGVRMVPLSPRAKAVLDMRRGQDASPFVFPSVASETGHRVTFGKAHGLACRAAGLKPFPIYTWRHTFGTRCAEAGVDRYTLARWMGHANPNIAARYYVHVSERHEQAGFEKFVQYSEKLRSEAIPLVTDKVQ
jgi:integrase